jgi:hypothetical protein
MLSTSQLCFVASGTARKKFPSQLSQLPLAVPEMVPTGHWMQVGAPSSE